MSSVASKLGPEIYERWFGIARQNCPPDHYSLLGIARFESDVEAIQQAADARMMQLREHQLGKYRKESQQLLNEIAAARLCLLTDHEKRAYDARLLQQQRSARLAPLPGQPEKIHPNDIPIRTPDHLRGGVSDSAGSPQLPSQVSPTPSLESYLTDWRWLVPASLGLTALIVLLVALMWRLGQ